MNRSKTIAAGMGSLLFLFPMASRAQTEAAPPAAEDPQAQAPNIELPAQAPAGPNKAAQSREGIEEVVVTARRTAESQQDVPVAVTALSASALQREGIQNSMDLMGRVPSLVMSTGGQLRSSEVPTIRGQGATFTGGSGVALYFAEVPLPADTTLSNVGGPGKYFDLENVQILKGSQGTLFGKNTTGGALLLTPAKPQNEFSGFITADGGNYEAKTIEGVVNVPVIDDKLLVRVGAQYVNREGFTKDVVTGKDYDNRDYFTSRLGITWRPTDAIENYFFAYYTLSRDNGNGTVMKAVNSEGLNELLMSQLGLQALPGVDPQVQPGCLLWDVALAKDPTNRCGQKFADEQNARDNRHVQLSADPDDHVLTGGAIDNLSFNLNEQLTIRDIASFSVLQHQYRWDHDGSRAQWVDFILPNNEKEGDDGVVTNEIQLHGNYRDGKLPFTTGFYFESQKPLGPENELIDALYNSAMYSYHLDKQSFGPYAQATYDIGDIVDRLDGLKITGGLRYTFDDIKGRSTAQQTEFGITMPETDHSGTIKDSALTWTIGADYRANIGDDSTLFYGKVSRGYKAGGFAITAVNPANLVFKPEYVLNYEVGEKSDFKVEDIPVRLNAAAYYTDYTNMQRNGVDVYTNPNSVSPAPALGAAVFNAGKAFIEGAEFEATVIPVRGLNLTANYSYTYAAYKQYELVSGSSIPQLDCSGTTHPQGSELNLSCAPFLYTPRHQYSVTASYMIPVDEKIGDIETSVTYTWTDTNYTSATTLPAAEPGAYLQSMGLMNASISWNHMFGSTVGLQAFGTNLLNKEYIISNDNVWTTLAYRSVTYNEPRMFGAKLTYHFGAGS